MRIDELSEEEMDMVLKGEDILIRHSYEYDVHYKEENWTILSDKEKLLIKKWIRFMFSYGKTLNKDRTSYELKHLCESDVGFYVHNDTIKKAFILEGYKAKTGKINWYFNANGKINIEKSKKFRRLFKEEIESVKNH